MCKASGAAHSYFMVRRFDCSLTGAYGAYQTNACGVPPGEQFGETCEQSSPTGDGGFYCDKCTFQSTVTYTHPCGDFTCRFGTCGDSNYGGCGHGVCDCTNEMTAYDPNVVTYGLLMQYDYSIGMTMATVSGTCF